MDFNLNLDVNKKSLVQIALLVVLVGVGVGAYLFQQDGDGLGFVTSYFADKPAPPPQPTQPTPKPRAANTPKVAVPKPKSAAPAIPAHAAQGQIHGNPFVVDGGSFRHGVLTLSQVKAPAAQISIQLPTPKWEVPSGKNMKYVNPTGPEAPKIEVQRSEVTGSPGAQTITEGYTLFLEFGQSQGRKLPGKLRLALPEQAKSQVAGTFEVDIQGFHIIDGKPDLSSDTMDTLEFLALTEILKEDPSKPVKDIVFRHGRFDGHNPSGNPVTAYLEIQYRIETGAPLTERYQFDKVKDSWSVHRKLRANQLDEAHPRKAPGRNEPPSTLLIYHAAKRLEADVAKKHPGKGIHNATFVTRHSDNHKIAICQISYSRDVEGSPVKTTYLFRLKKNTWVLEREMAKKEKVNFITGKIERS
jgi:hypothetical protein